ncbi:MAG: MoaD/ThiS family protein [Candidatus Helarchaeota archaeon]|nr:MoaD/ThiS family protein [Candidatus Helarchaeota archaeon]
MIKVKINFMSILGEMIGVHEAIIELPENSTFKNLIEQIKETYGKKFPKQLYKDGEFQYMHLMLNRRDIYEQKDADHPLKDGDVLYFIPPIGGG